MQIVDDHKKTLSFKVIRGMQIWRARYWVPPLEVETELMTFDAGESGRVGVLMRCWWGWKLAQGPWKSISQLTCSKITSILLIQPSLFWKFNLQICLQVCEMAYVQVYSLWLYLYGIREKKSKKAYQREPYEMNYGTTRQWNSVQLKKE